MRDTQSGEEKWPLVKTEKRPNRSWAAKSLWEAGCWIHRKMKPTAHDSLAVWGAETARVPGLTRCCGFSSWAQPNSTRIKVWGAGKKNRTDLSPQQVEGQFLLWSGRSQRLGEESTDHKVPVEQEVCSRMTAFLPSGSRYVDEVMTMISSYLTTIIMVPSPHRWN